MTGPERQDLATAITLITSLSARVDNRFDAMDATIRNIEQRVQAIDTSSKVDRAVSGKLAEIAGEARITKRWIMGFGVSAVGGLVSGLVALLKLLPS